MEGSAEQTAQSKGKMIRKLLTKPVWWWERRRSYPIRSRYLSLPAIPVETAPVQFVVLTTPASLKDALWTAWSWYRYLQPHKFQLQMAVDGNIADADAASIQQLFPGVGIYQVEPLLDRLLESWPALSLFLRKHPLGRKLALVLTLSGQGSFLYADHDVLAFNAPSELITCTKEGVPCYFVEEREGNCDPAILDRCKDLGVNYISRFNSGLLYIPRGTLSLELAAELLARWHPPVISWFSEQTVLSILMRQANAMPLPKDRYVVSACRQFYWEKDVDYRTIAARHFTGTVRHVMYRKGIPAILRQSRQISN